MSGLALPLVIRQGECQRSQCWQRAVFAVTVAAAGRELQALPGQDCRLTATPLEEMLYCLPTLQSTEPSRNCWEVDSAARGSSLRLKQINTMGHYTNRSSANEG